MKEGDLVRYKGRGLWQIVKIRSYVSTGTHDHIGEELVCEYHIEWFSGKKERAWFPFGRQETKIVCTPRCLEELTEMEILALAAKG